MRTIIKFIVIFFLLFNFSGIAQEPGDTRPLADKSTLKGEKELRREKRIKRHSRKNAKKQERIAASKTVGKRYTVHLFKTKRKKAKKTKERRKSEASKG